MEKEKKFTVTTKFYFDPSFTVPPGAIPHIVIERSHNEAVMIMGPKEQRVKIIRTEWSIIEQKEE